MRLRYFAVMLLALAGTAFPVHAATSIRNLDFNNFTYQLRSGGMGPSGAITLNQGNYRQEFSSVWLRNLYYTDLNGDGAEDALVVLAASGGGSGVSTHAFGFTYSNGRLEEILYRINFINIRALHNGFTLVSASPLSTGFQDCSANSFMRINAVEVGTYEWNGTDFVLVNKATVKGQQVCDLR
jgi:hypothetical protein